MSGGGHQSASREGPSNGSHAFEDYAKAIYSLRGQAADPVGTGEIAGRLGVSPGAVTTMLKRMEAEGLARRRPYHGVELTEEGERTALRVIRNHRLLEAFLTEKLGMAWDRVHDEAEVLEHHISDELRELIADSLGQPGFDPHGDPIPDVSLKLRTETGVRLAAVEPGSSAVVSRVSDSDPEVLRALDESGLRPGVRVEVVGTDHLAGGMRVRVGETERVIADRIAGRILVAPG